MQLLISSVILVCLCLFFCFIGWSYHLLAKRIIQCQGQDNKKPRKKQKLDPFYVPFLYAIYLGTRFIKVSLSLCLSFLGYVHPICKYFTLHMITFQFSLKSFWVLLLDQYFSYETLIHPIHDKRRVTFILLEFMFNVFFSFPHSKDLLCVVCGLSNVTFVLSEKIKI